MAQPTEPRISDAQNTDDSRRLVAAQSRMYSDAKAVFFSRITTVFLLSGLTILASASLPDSRALVGGGGGLLLFFGSLVVDTVEKRKRLQAAATQEVFDTRVFQIEWNSVMAERPSNAAIAQAARRYDGGRDANWYDPTDETKRPFDILICQATNLGWGASMHWLWSCILASIAALIVAAIGATWAGLSLSFEDALTILLLPSLAPLKETIGLVKTNVESWRTKESTERTLNALWEDGLSGQRDINDRDVRQLQDKILLLRQTNGYVPDWLDSLFHAKNEAAMRDSVADRVAQARRAE